VSRRLTLEVPVTTPDDARAAEGGGADRLELCSALEVGGLTPTVGLLMAVKAAVGLPVWCLIRCRPGGFVYSPEELVVMLTDARMLLDSGADGIVVGCLTPDLQIDAESCTRFLSLAGRKISFHRAFDFAPDHEASLEALIHLGIRRVLTSGGEATATAGSARLRKLVSQSADRITILAGGGVRPHNVAQLLRESGCDEVHASLRMPFTDMGLSGGGDLALQMGAAGGARSVTDPGQVAAMRRALDSI
jgi:copper homeostasis protein